MDGTWENEFSFFLLAIKFVFYVPQYLKQWGKTATNVSSNDLKDTYLAKMYLYEFCHPLRQSNELRHVQPQNHFHKSWQNAFLKTVFYNSA